MANLDMPRGLWPVANLNGSPYNGGTVKVAFQSSDETATFVGDPVKFDGGGVTDTTGSGGSYPSVAQAAASSEMCGVIVAFEPVRTNLELKYRLADTQRFAYMAPAVQGQLFAVQCSGAFALTALGNTADIVVGSGNTKTGISAVELDSSNIGTTKEGLHIVGVVNRPDNTIGTNCDVIVRIAENQYGADATGI